MQQLHSFGRLRFRTNFFLLILIAFTFGIIQACTTPTLKPTSNLPLPDKANLDSSTLIDSLIVSETSPLEKVDQDSFPPMPAGFLNFARSLIGVPYVYASTDPAIGFDCSGFISHVFNHFDISVPRSSVDFTNYGYDVPLEEARPGDLILYTGTDSSIRVVGHMGIVEKRNNGKLYFIHSTSGKANGVTITQLNPYYMGRFVKIIRVFSNQ